MKKTRILIIILSLVIWFADRIEATWATFLAEVQNATARTINFSAHATDSLTWGASLIVRGNHTLVGLRGASPAIANGNNQYRGFYIGGKRIVFYDKWTFQNFRVTGSTSGAVFLSENSIVKFSSVTMSFIDNYAGKNAGALYLSGGFFDFERSTVAFRNNRSDDRGGAIFAANTASLYFTSSTVIFELNKAQTAATDIHGGAIYVGASSIVFSYSRVSFSSNSTAGARSLGGALYLTGANSRGYFINSVVNFSSNISNGYEASRGGGAIALWNDAKVHFFSSTVSFWGNKAINTGAGGGAININKSGSEAIFRDSKIDFTSNTAQYGGAIFLSFEQNASLSATNSNFAFIKNNAIVEGGAIYNNQGHINFNNATINFTGNSANSLGGAIYTADVSITTLNAGGQILFRDNTMGTGANKKPNDIYMNGGRLYLIANQYQIRMEGGIWATNSSHISYSDTTGNWYLSGWNVFENMGSFSIGAKSSVTVANATWTYRNSPVFKLPNSTMTFIASSAAFIGNNAKALSIEASSFAFVGGYLGFIQNKDGTSGDGAAIKVSVKSRLLFSNAVVEFFKNRVESAHSGNTSGGAPLHLFDRSIVEFSKSQVAFTSNVAVYSQGFGGAIYFHDGESNTVIFSSSVVNFLYNEVTGAGGAIGAWGADDILRFFNSTAVFIGNKSAGVYGGSFTGGGAILFSGDIDVLDSSMAFVDNISEQRVGGAIRLSRNLNIKAINSDTYFYFKGNKHNTSADNDIYGGNVYIEAMAGRNVFMTNGLRMEGGTLYKRGAGRLIFAGDDSIIKNTFNIEMGTAVFHSLKSTVNVITVSAPGILSLRDGSTSTLFINGNFTLSGALALDFNFNTNHQSNPKLSTGDFVYVHGDLNINAGALLAPNITKAPNTNSIMGISSIPFVRASNSPNINNLTVKHTGAGYPSYIVRWVGNIGWLVYAGGWNAFVNLFVGIPSGQTITLLRDIVAGDDGSPIRPLWDRTTGIVTINGDFHTIDANLNSPTLGFAATDIKLTIRDVVFLRFKSDSGGVNEEKQSLFRMENATASTVAFNGMVRVGANIGKTGVFLVKDGFKTIEFSNASVYFTTNTNTNTTRYGAVFTFEGNADTLFNIINSAVYFTSNTAYSNGGVLGKINDKLRAKAQNSILHFTSNTAIVSGGAVYINSPNTIFEINNTSAYFIDNRANTGSGGAIYMTDASSLTINNGRQEAIFRGNKMSASNIQNDIWMNNKATLYINTAGQVKMLSGLYADNAYVYKIGAGTWTLSGYSHLKNLAAPLNQGLIRVLDGIFLWDIGGNSLNRFMPNSAGLIFEAIKSSLTFINGKGNQNGGAIFAANNAVIKISTSRIYFIDNRITDARSGGALLFSGNASLLFEYSTVVFRSNFANNHGGALYWNTAKLIFADSYLTVEKGTANKGGGGFVIFNNSTFNFTGGTAKFFDNHSNYQTGDSDRDQEGGGALWAAGNTAHVNFTGAILYFSSNTSSRHGGAIWMGKVTTYQTDKQQINIKFSTADFSFNVAQASGGAVFLIGKLAAENSRLDFNNNKAISGFGGAIFASGGTSISFISANLTAGQTARSAHQVVFYGNTAAGKPNDICLNNSQLWMTGSIWMEGGIYATAKSSISYSGRHWYLIGINSFDDMGRFSIGAQSSVTVVNATWTYRNSPHWDIGGSSTITFINSSAAFIANSGGSGGAIYNYRSNINFTSSIVHFTSNSASSGGGALLAYYSNINFTSSIVHFTSNSANSQGGAIYAVEYSNINFTNSIVHFTSNSASSGGGALLAVNTIIHFTSSAVNFTGNSAGQNGGAIYANTSNINFTSSVVNFTSNSANSHGGAIYLDSAQSSITFSALSADTELIFKNNKLNNGDLNDVYINNAGALFVFDAATGRSINLSNGLRSDGVANSQIRKTGGGKVVFSGADTIMMNTFNIEAGTAVFQSAKSTVGVLSISAGAMLDLRGGSTSTLFITGTLTSDLSGNLGLDFNFAAYADHPSKSTSDFIWAANTVNILAGALAANISVADSANTLYGSSIAFMKGATISGETNLAAPTDYAIVKDNNILWLLYGGTNPWDSFVSLYQFSDSGSLTLNSDINAWGIGALSFGDSKTGAKNLMVDGKYHIVHSSGFANKGFVITDSSITFRDITFTSFVRIGGAGGVMNISNSTVIFRGSMSWINNASNLEGGAIDAYASNINFTSSAVNFINNNVVNMGGAIHVKEISLSINFTSSVVNFTSNSATFGGAISAEYSANIKFTSSAVNFTSNTAMYGGAIIVFPANISFTNSSVNFINNTATTIYGGAIYADSRSSISFISSNLAAGQTLRNAHQVVFYGNKASGKPNDIHLDNSQLWMTGSIWMEGGISATAKSTISYSGRTWYLSGINSFDDMGRFAVGTGSSITVKNATWTFSNASIVNARLSLTANAVMTFQQSSVSFINNSGGNTVGGSAFYVIQSTLNFSNVKAFFLDNKLTNNSGGYNDGAAIKADKALVRFVGGKSIFEGNIADIDAGHDGGALNADYGALIEFSATSAVFHKNITYRYGGAIETYGGGIVSFVDSHIEFSSNAAVTAGGAISAYYGGNSKISFANSYVEFSSNAAAQGGAVNATDGKIELKDSRVYFFANKATTNGGAIYLQNATSLLTISALTKDTLILFKDNAANAVLNDVYIANANAWLVFDAASGRSINLSNGLRTDGVANNQIRKTGGGRIVFSGDASIIRSSFNVLAGTAVFQSAKSTISVLQIAAGAMLDLRGGSTSTLFITGAGAAFVLNGHLGLDFNFAAHADHPSKSTSDFIYASNSINISASSLLINVIVAPTTLYGSSIAFMRGSAINGEGALAAPAGYAIAKSANVLWLIKGGTNPWDSFVSLYQVSDSGSIALNSDINAWGIGALSFADSLTGAKKLTVDGKFHIVHSSGFANKGFVITNSSITFRDIKFTSFSRTGTGGAGSGGVMNISNSTMVFRGTVSWINNVAAVAGGSIYASRSSMSFVSAYIAFTSNAAKAGVGGAVYIYDKSVLSVIRTTISFSWNMAEAAGNGGGLALATDSMANFINSKTIFEGNEASKNTSNPWGGAIWVVWGSTVNFLGGEAYFKKNKADGTSGGYGGALIISGQAPNGGNNKSNRAVFENMRVLEFSSNSARYGGGALYIYQAGAYLAIKNNAQVFFFGNETFYSAGGYGGGAIGLSVTGGALMEIVNNSTVVFRGNKTVGYGGAIHFGFPSRLNLENTAAQRIVFENNQQLGTQPNDVYIGAVGSTLSMKIAGQIKMMSGFQAIAGSIFKTEAGTWTVSGLNILRSLDVPLDINGTLSIENATFTWTSIGAKGLRLQANSVLEIKDSSTAFVGGATAGSFGGAITINNVSAKFSAISRDVNAYFNANTKDGVSNDVYLSNAAGWLVLDASAGRSINFNNGLRTDGVANSRIEKNGGGVLFFGGADTVIKNRFDVLAGTVIFRAAKSTISVLTIAANAALDLMDGITTNTVFIGSGNNISDGAFLGFDFGFDDAGGGANQWSDKLIADFDLTIGSAVIFANIVSNTNVYGSSISFIKASPLNVFLSGLTLIPNDANGIYRLDFSDDILWLVFGSGSPWDEFVFCYLNSQEGDMVYLPQDIWAFSGALALDMPLNGIANFTIEGSGFTANALNNLDLGFLLINSSITFRNIHLSNFISTSTDRKGGAMTVIDSQIFLEGNFMFFNNVSTETNDGGGAIYIENSTAYFNASAAPMRMIFKNNLAPFGQDVYAVNSSLIFDASGFVINMENGLRMAGGGKIIKTGTKDLIFDGEDSVLTSVDIEQGAIVFKSQGSSVENIDVKSSAALSLGNGAFNNLFVGALLSSGTLNLDMDFTFTHALGDVIFGGNVFIASGSALTINPIKRQTWVYGSSGTIIFTNPDGLSLNISDIFYDRNLYKLFKTNDSLVIMFIGSDFPKLDLTHNQKEAYELLKEIVKMRRSGDFGFFGQSSDFEERIEEMDAVIRDVLAGSADDSRRALDALSGSFLAQTLVHIAADNPHQLLYSKAHPYSLDGLPKREDRVRTLTLKSFWTDVGAKISQTSDEKNLLGDFNKASAQAALGLTFIETTDISAGAFASFCGAKMEQSGNEAEVQSYEGGFYGGSFSELFNHKYFAALSYHEVLTKREVDLGAGYKPRAQFNLYGLKAGGESAVALKIFRKLDIALHGGLIASALYNDEINESGGGAIGLTVAPSNYQRLEGYAGIKVGKRHWHISAEAGYLFYGNLDEARFAMFMSGFNHKMDIEGSNVHPLSFALKFGTDKRLSDDVYLQTLAGISADRDLGGKRAGLNISLKYLFPTRMSARIYRDLASKYDPYLLEKEFIRPREELLLDEDTGWVDFRGGEMTSTAMNGEINSRGGELSSPAMYGEINPDEAGENYLRKRSKGKNHLAVQVLAEKDGALMWRTFIISDMKIFPENDAELPPSLTNNIRDKMDDMDDKKMKIARVRIARYGHFIDDKELRFAELRAERIYQEILSYKDEMAAVKAANLKKELELRERRDREKADKIQRELEEKNRRRQEAEQESKRARQAPLDTAKIKEAQERREKSIIAYKLKAASFETGRSQLSQEALRNIALIAAEIKERNYKMITVEGHSDSTGSESQNQILAAQRATAVYMELLKLGIPSNKMKFISCGSSIPIAENVTPQGRALNRRVEIFVE